MAEEVKLFRTWSSPYGLRVVWALKLKGIECETIFEDLANKSPLLLQYNPVYKKIPVLVHNGKPISESLIILEYIDETWKQYPLFPADPYEKAMARFWAKFSEEKLLPSVWTVFVCDGKQQEDAIAAATENLKLLEEQLKGKKFFGGETIGYLDLALGWLADMIGTLEGVTGVNLIEAEKFPLLAAWIQNFADTPAIKEYLPPRDKMVANFKAIREAHLAPAASK